MKKYILYATLFGLAPFLHASGEPLEWVHKVDRKVLRELDASSGDYTSLHHHQEYSKKIRIPFQLSGVLIYEKDRGYCVYELGSKRCVILASFGKKAGMKYTLTGLKHIGYQMLRSTKERITDMDFVYGRVFEVIDEDYSISITTKKHSQIYKGSIPKR